MAIDDWRQLRYHHLGIPTTTPRAGEVFLAKFGMHVSGLDTGPFGIEWLRFEDDSPLPELVRKQPHLAFVVDDLEAALCGEDVLIEANSPSDGVTVAFITHNGTPVELLSFVDSDHEIWTGGEQRRPAGAARLRDLASRWLIEGWQKGRPEMVADLHAPGFIDHDPASRRSDRAGFAEGIAALYEAFPDFHAEIEDLVADEYTGKVTLRWSATGTHRGSFVGLEPTGRRIEFKGIEILRVDNDLIVERWGEWDGISLLQQLGGFER